MIETLKKDVLAQRLGKITFISILKALLINRSVQMLVLYRLAKKISHITILGGPLSKILSYISRVIIPCELSIHADISPGVYFPHPIGIVIGADVFVAEGVTIYQNVTLGRKDYSVSEYPNINKNVIIYSGAVIVGSVTVGEGSIVGANAVVTKIVGPYEIVGGVPAKRLKKINT
jgi:serine O-acetyltransferase